MSDELERMWTEEFRPQTLDDVVGHEHIVRRLKELAKRPDMPHLLFSGPPGVGKTTCAEALVNEIYNGKPGKNVRRLNASDDRGIDVVRHSIKTFASLMPYDGARFKILILDEADLMTSDAQNALRRIMEQYSRTTRFILLCNYSSKIIDPIQSRCALFRFPPLDKEAIIGRLRFIAEKKKLDIDDEAFEAIYIVSEGDLRRAINTLQSCAALGEKITKDVVYIVRSYAKPQELEQIIEETLKPKPSFQKARKLLLNMLNNYGLSGSDVVRFLNRTVVNFPPNKIDDIVRCHLIDYLAEIDYRISEGCDPIIQLESFVAKAILLSQKNTISGKS